MFDICLFRPNWRKEHNYDGLSKDCSNFSNFGNIPFSDVRHILKQGLIQL